MKPMSPTPAPAPTKSTAVERPRTIVPIVRITVLIIRIIVIIGIIRTNRRDFRRGRGWSRNLNRRLAGHWAVGRSHAWRRGLRVIVWHGAMLEFAITLQHGRGYLLRQSKGA